MDIPESFFCSYFSSCDDISSVRDFFDVNCSLKEYNIGESILPSSQFNNSLLFLLEGQVRHIFESQNHGCSLTVSKYTVPFIYNLHPVVFGDTHSDLFICSTNCKFLVVPYQSLSDLLCTDRSDDSLYTKFIDIDSWRLLSPFLNFDLCDSTSSLRKQIASLEFVVSAFYIYSQPELDSIFNSTDSFFIGQSQNSFNYGASLDHSQVNSLSLPVRILSIKSTHKKPLEIRSNVLTPTNITQSSSNNVEIASESVQKKRISSNSSSDIANGDGRVPNSSKFKHYPSDSETSSIITSCFRSLSSYFNLPFKPDVFKNIISEKCSSPDSTITLEFCAALAESLGLQTQLLSLPSSLIHRLQIPAFLQLSSSEICVASHINKTTLTISRPAHGMVQLAFNDLGMYLENESEIPVLIFRTTDLTPQKKFGLSWFLPSLKRHKRSLIEVFIASFFVQLFQLMNPLLVQQIIDKVIGQGGTGTLPVLAFMLFIFALFENILTALRTNLFIETTNRIDISLGEQVIDHLLKLPLNYFDKRPVGELSSRLSELENIRSFLTGTALTVVLDVIFSFIYVAVMLMYSWVLTIVALLLAPVLATITYSLSPVIRGQLRNKAELNAKTQNHLIEVLTGIQTVKAQNFERNARWRWKDRYSQYISKSFTNAVTSTTSNAITQFLNQSSNLLVLCVGTYLVITGELSLGQLIAFRIISGYVTTPLLRLSNLYQNFQQTSISLERLADIIDTPSESSDLDKLNIPMPTIVGSVSYKDVSFGFKPNTPLQISNVSLDIPSGQFVAIVGQSGSGKSTLTKLLPRLYNPSSGRIMIDDIDIIKVELYSLRSQIGIVPQDSLLFEGSVQDNISLSDPDATVDQIISAAKLACAHDFIMKLPSGYASPVGERGGSLSGGQRQRIAIARSILQNPRLLIMDEATSALDYETERSVSLNLMNQFREQTVLFITHRLTSIVHADMIVMMHDGRVDEVGTHDQLIEKKGRYFALFKQQESMAS